MTTEEAAPREEAASRGRYRDALRQRDDFDILAPFSSRTRAWM